MTEPLRIGILGAARIVDLALMEPAAALGARVVAVAARNQARAEAFASARGIPAAYDDYDALLADPDVEVVYNPTPNALHVQWTLAAIRAGKHVITEKPLASNAAEGALVPPVAKALGAVVFEGFHYRYHPVYQRFLDLLADGAIGELKRLEVTMKFECSDVSDIRWSWQLSGGCLMDLGCYAIHVARDVAALLGGEPTVLACLSGRREDADPRVDAWSQVTMLLPTGATAVLDTDLDAPRSHQILATGTRGTIWVPNYVNVHDDDRLVLRTAEGEVVEHHGRTSTYTHQLKAVHAAIRDGAPFPTTAEDGIANMAVIDECYRRAGLPLRRSSLTGR
jgi:predicted dehydrogenase